MIEITLSTLHPEQQKVIQDMYGDLTCKSVYIDVKGLHFVGYNNYELIYEPEYWSEYVRSKILAALNNQKDNFTIELSDFNKWSDDYYFQLFKKGKLDFKTIKSDYPHLLERQIFSSAVSHDIIANNAKELSKVKTQPDPNLVTLLYKAALRYRINSNTDCIALSKKKISQIDACNLTVEENKNLIPETWTLNLNCSNDSWIEIAGNKLKSELTQLGRLSEKLGTNHIIQSRPKV